MDKLKLVILYATETGNAQDVAERIAREAGRRHYQPVLLSTQAYEANNLPSEDTVVFVASTCGQGDAPASMKIFWRQLLRKSLGQSWLRGVHFAVFGLGDSGYQKYNLVAKKLDRRLSDLGGEAIVPKGLGDDQHPSGYEAALDPWLSNFWAVMRDRVPLPSGIRDPDSKNIGDPELDSPKFKVTYHDPPAAEQISALRTTDPSVMQSAQEKWIEHQRARVMLDSAAGDVPNVIGNDVPGCSPDSPVFAQMIRNERLTSEDHEQNVRHIEFDLCQCGVRYSPGDVLSVLPNQDHDAVDRFLKRLCLDGAAHVTVENLQSSLECGWKQPQMLQLGPIKLRSLIEGMSDVSAASPRRYFFEVMSHFASADHEKEKLQYFASSVGRDELHQYNQREGRSVLEVLEDFPSVNLPLEWVLQLVPRLKPRSFSIASAPRAHPNQAHITLAVVNWVTPFKRHRRGLCSNWLSELNPREGEVRVPLWISRGALKMPSSSVPLILVGPGTGCAPFRSFLEDRVTVGASKPVAPALFFFGCRNEAKDYLYKDFWFSCAEGNGVLSPVSGGGLYVAFSRDQSQKVYVQHKIHENRQLVWKLLQAGASVFISGSANKMPAQVTSAIEEVIMSEGGVDRESAIRQVKILERVGRFSVEVWS